MNDADPDLAIALTPGGASGGSGQTATASSRLVVRNAKDKAYGEMPVGV